jgi:hypothetical protein
MKNFISFITEKIGEANEGPFFGYEKGWFNPAKSLYIPVSTPNRYHIQVVINNLTKFGVTKRKVNDLIVQETGFTDESMIGKYFDNIKSGVTDVFYPLERVVNEKGWIRIVNSASTSYNKVYLSSSSIPYLKRGVADLLPYWGKKVDVIGIDIEPNSDYSQDRSYVNIGDLKTAERWARR